jgi:hypothetical protein
MNRGVRLLAGVTARDDFAGGAIGEANAMDAEAIFAVRQRDIAAPQFLSLRRSHDNGIALQNIGLHALTVRAETHISAALEERLAKGRKLRGVALFDGLTLRHGR